MILATCVLLVAAGGFWFALRTSTTLQLLVDLISDAGRLALMVVRSPSDDPVPYALDLRPQLFSLRYSGANANGYYQVWASDGSTIARSPSLGGADLPRPTLADQTQGPWAPPAGTLPDPESLPRFENQDLEISDVVLPGQVQGFQCWIRFNPLRGPVLPGPGERDDFVVIAVAKRAEAFDAEIRDLTIIIAGFALTALLVFRLVIGLVVRRGLSPLRALTSEVEHLDTAPGSRVRETGMSRETAPVAAALNTLLARSDQTLERERRFSENAAHELRTPLAEIRVIADVARRLGTTQAAADAVQDIAQSAAQMDAVLSALLRISRRTMESERHPPTPFDTASLAAVAERALRRHAEALAQRRVRTTLDAGPARSLIGDAAAIGTILSNLIDNAAEYTPEGGTISVGIAADDHALTLQVRNAPVTLTQSDIERMFEPFWRKDPTRGRGEHSGLGLPIVRAMAESMNASATASLDAATATLTMAVRIPTPAR